MSLASAHEQGMSQYFLSIVPAFWRTTLRRNTRIFQHKDTPTIVQELLEKWAIRPMMLLASKYKKHEYCVQYEETDYSFICRLLEDAGISYYFVNSATTGSGDSITKLVMNDCPQQNAARADDLAYWNTDTPRFGADDDFCASVTLSHAVSPGRFTLRDYDFRLKPWAPLFVEARSGTADEDVYEQFEYAPGVHLWESRKHDNQPLADHYNGGEETDLTEGLNTAEHAMNGGRGQGLTVSFITNALDLCPGSVVGINQGEPSGHPNHPRDELAPGNTLLLVQSSIEGANDGDWTMSVTGVFSTLTYRPRRTTPRPRIMGVQTAIVVGPAKQEIYSDEFGRVRVQFPWDREGKYDDNSSCWLRVSQSWAGGSFGMMNIPRVGHEVLVEFFEGNPDQPVITGRVHNATTGVPYKLPDNQTQSGWKTNSTPGGVGYNELMFEDKAGQEVIHIQAQKDLTYVVNNSVAGQIDASRYVQVGVADMVDVGSLHSVSVGKTTGIEIHKEQIIILSTGGASIKLSGNDIFLNAKGSIHMHAGNGAPAVHISAAAGNIQIQGGSDVRINDASSGPPPDVDAIRPAQPPGAGGKGTPPALPSGGESIQEPGGFPDVDVPSS